MSVNIGQGNYLTINSKQNLELFQQVQVSAQKFVSSRKRWFFWALRSDQQVPHTLAFISDLHLHEKSSLSLDAWSFWHQVTFFNFGRDKENADEYCLKVFCKNSLFYQSTKALLIIDNLNVSFLIHFFSQWTRNRSGEFFNRSSWRRWTTLWTIRI